MCARCNNERTQPHDCAWETLSEHIRTSWRAIRLRGSVDLRAAFGEPGGVANALNVHLYFLKLLGCKARQDGEPLPVDEFAACIMANRPHPDVSLYLAPAAIPRRVLAFDGDVYKQWNRDANRLDGAMWGYVVRPIAVKVTFIRAGTPLYMRGHPWHPSQPRRFVRLSPYHGGIEPIQGLARDVGDHVG